MKKGFSLIELVISLAIVSFLVLILSNLFSLNINFLNKSYKDEKDYKETYTAMVYIDTILRKSHEIKEDNHKDTNFTGFLMANGNKEVSYYFYSKNGFLYIYRSDLAKVSSGKDYIISECGDIDLVYDPDNKIINISLTSKNGAYNFESAVFVGDKLWKKPL